MCDFRSPPKFVINPDTNEQEFAIYKGVIGVNKQLAEWANTISKDEVTENGVYYISATGAGYDYFYNGKWYGYDYMIFDEHNDLECCFRNVLLNDIQYYFPTGLYKENENSLYL